MAAVTTFTGGTIAYSGGTMSLPVLATGNNTTFEISSALSLPDLATAKGATFQITNGVTTTLPELTDADGASLEASGGASLTLPILTAYNSGSGYTSTFSATGTGSDLSLPELATITANTNFETAVQISSSTGGAVEIAQADPINGAGHDFEQHGHRGRGGDRPHSPAGRSRIPAVR